MADQITHALLSDSLKFDKQADGTLIVYGKAADETLDRDLQICDPDWLKSAMPGWMASGAAIREMHQPIAAGVGVELDVRDDGHYVTAKVVDPGTVTKVEQDVLKGLSVGIKRPQVVKDVAAPGGRIVGGEIIEISLVDVPSNPNAKVAIAKSAAAGELEATDIAEQVDPTPAEDPEKPAEAPTAPATAEEAPEAAPEAAEVAPEAADADKAVQPDAKKDAWGAAMAGETVGQLRALRGQLPDDPTGTDAVLAGILDALLGMAYQEEAEEATEDTDDLRLAATADTDKVSGADAPDSTTALTADTLKAFMADTFKAALEDGLAPVKEELAKVSGLTDRVQAIEDQPAIPKAVLTPADRTGSLDPFQEVDPKALLISRRDRHQSFADTAVDGTTRSLHLSKVAELTTAIAKLSA